MRDLGEEVNIAGRILFLLLARSNAFFVLFTMEKKVSNNSLWTSRLRFGIENKVKYGSPLRHMENQAQEQKHVSLSSSFFVFLRASLKAYST